MAVLFSADPIFRGHDSGSGHPERPARIDAVNLGLTRHHLEDLLVPLVPRSATDAELRLAHSEQHIQDLISLSASGGGRVDLDTYVGSSSESLARLGSGTLLSAVDVLAGDPAESSDAPESAFIAVRPPGHHATADQSMGFCLYNHVAVAASYLASMGNRVVVVDIDAHHGNGTQDIFYSHPDVLYVSWHQSPMYPFSGYADEVGVSEGLGYTFNQPLPAGATGEHYRRGIEESVAPLVESFGADWMLISAGFDAHRADPLCNLGLSSGDIADIVLDLVQLVPERRVLAVVEGGYDLDAIAECSAATVSALAGVRLHSEAPTTGGPGSKAITDATETRNRATG